MVGEGGQPSDDLLSKTYLEFFCIVAGESVSHHLQLCIPRIADEWFGLDESEARLLLVEDWTVCLEDWTVCVQGLVECVAARV